MQESAEHTVLPSGGDNTAAVLTTAHAAKCHREATFRRAAAPAVRLPHQPGNLIGRNVLDAADLGYIALTADPGHHLTNVAHGPALQRKVRHADYSLVAKLQRSQAALPAPDFSPELTTADDGRYPGMPGRLVKECVHCSGPGFRITDRITARQHHPGQDAVPDTGLTGRRPDDALVITEREVPERVLVTMPVEQLPDALRVGRTQATWRLGRPEEQKQCGKQREQPKTPGHETKMVLPELGVELHGAREPGHIHHDGVDPVPHCVATAKATEQCDVDQPDDHISGQQAGEHPQCPPPRTPVTDGVELPPVAEERDQ